MDKMLEEYDGDCEKSVEGILKALWRNTLQTTAILSHEGRETLGNISIRREVVLHEQDR